MLIKKPNDIKASEITDKALFLSRRRFLAGAAVAGATIAGLTNMDFFERSAAHAGEKLSGVQKSRFSTTETLTPLKDVTTYNNFYEFGTDKYSPAQYAKTLMPRPWTVAVEGEIKKPKRYDIDELMKLAPLEERVYRLRCVEGWSMVIPWIGFPLNALIKQVEPTSKAKYVEFTTLLDPKQMPEQKSRMVLDWPYIEGLRIDEANNPLAILCVGLYGEVLPNQNGAPIRMIVPWKYGFKSVKSIVKIRFVEQQPTTTWMKAGPTEYGFYSNVNPEVDHPRWSQARERRIGEFIKRKTLMFNGYGDQVASMYQGMDLRKYF
ncbi:MAG TPA: protein-methionine-sulfoxide reductase catalytic subunit MsrP [Verrucomicrobiae bacterium]|jgi:methionine sulfoxide reductase catalytic subunit|nr:protein-methionine-sulfoxide reductase catalytic subunit MsrP [Verrucomicrobiae bacterium]